jgi:hypothetical protein
MSEKITITSITANTPVDVFYCDSTQENCNYVDNVSVFPYTFYVEPPYDEKDILILVIDSKGCTVNHQIYITPTPTPSVTFTPTPSITFTPTKTNNPTPTPTITPEPVICESYTITLNEGESLTYTYIDCHGNDKTYILTDFEVNFCAKFDTVFILNGVGDIYDNGICYEPDITPTPTSTPTPTMESIISEHYIAIQSYSDVFISCKERMSLIKYYTYKSESDLTPEYGAIVYMSENNSVLYNPYNGNDLYLKMNFGGTYYSVQINSSGEITDFTECL